MSGEQVVKHLQRIAAYIEVRFSRHAVERIEQRFARHGATEIPYHELRLFGARYSVGKTFRMASNSVMYVCARRKGRVVVLTVYPTALSDTDWQPEAFVPSREAV